MPKTGAFESYCEEYDAWFEQHRALYAAELDAVRRLLPPVDRALEVGVGSARFAAPLGIGFGLEPSEKMVLKAKARGVRVVRGVAEALPFADSVWPLVVMVTTICFLEDVRTAFREAFRVLKPGGWLVVGFIDKLSELGARYARERDNSRFYKEADFHSAPQVIALFSDTGFRQLRVLQTLVPGDPAGSISDGHGKGAFVVVRGTRAAA